MEQNNKPPKEYRGTRGLSLAIVIGVAIGTVIGKLMDNMNTGLMIGLMIGVMGWVLLFNRRQKPDTMSDASDSAQQKQNKSDSDTK